MTQAQLAAALGISERMVRTYAARGMPTTSIEDALSWKTAHVRPRAGPEADQAAEAEMLARRFELAIELLVCGGALVPAAIAAKHAGLTEAATREVLLGFTSGIATVAHGVTGRLPPALSDEIAAWISAPFGRFPGAKDAVRDL